MRKRNLIKLVILILVLAVFIPLLKPKIALFFSLFSLTYGRLKQYEEAKEYIYSVAEKGPDHREAFFTQDRIYENLGEIEKDISELEKAREFVTRAGLIGDYILRLKTKGITSKDKKSFHSDTVLYLTNGRQIQGKFKKEKGNRIFLDVLVGDSFGTIGINRQDVKSLKKLK